jgi:metal-responsive CopG/Arc/MetJ family transcriptional regulator
MASHRLEITVPSDLLTQLDKARGFESRASFVRRALESALSIRSEGAASGAIPAISPKPQPAAPSRASKKPTVAEQWRR